MKRCAIILSIILTLLPLCAYAQSPAIDAGLGYLTTSQNSDRSWGGAGGSTGTVASTVAVLDTMKLLNQTDLYEYTGAVSWLQKQDLDTTEHLSERINVLTIGGADATKLLSYLDSLMNAWGGYNDYGVSIIDTVHALQALRTINHPDSSTFAAALGYLTTTQNSDGGWGFFKGDASNTYVTSLVLRTLSEFKATYSGLQPTIASAVTFILSKQDTTSAVPGGFGSSPSTVHETALAYETLVASGADVSAAIPQAIAYLTQTQLANGSWNNDAYATALALKALSDVKPNLSVSSADITLSDANLTIGEHITISAIIKNTGLVSADRITVNIYDGDPIKGALPLTSQIIATLSAGGQITLSVPYVVSASGSHAITVWVDPLNQIPEVTKADNRASRNLWGATMPDVAVLSGDIAPSTSYPAVGASFDVAFKLRNLGETEAYPVNTALYDGDPAQGGTIIGYGMPTTVKGGETRGNVVTGAVLNTPGQHTLYLVANYDNQVTESSLANNTASFTVNVGGTPPPVDLAMLPSDLTITPQRPATGETVEIRAWIRNLGQDMASGFLMEFYDGDPSAGGILIDRRTLSLAGGNDQIVAVNWAVPAGIHTIYAILDQTNVVAETNELNNRTSVTIMADMVDIAVTASDMVFTPAHPVDGDNVTFTANVRNTGIMGTGPFAVELYDGDPAAGGTLLQTYSISNIPGDGNQTLTYAFTAVPHTYRFHVKADTASQVFEMYEDNNLAVRSVKVKAPSEVLGPDLVPVKFDLSDAITDPQSLALSGTAHVTFQNKGDDKIITPFTVM
ncbi:MAG: CARDB domain-containing protein, partial [Nitrospirota bacterium]